MKKKISSIDKINQINKVSVFYRDNKVGELAMTPSQRCAFEYERDTIGQVYRID